MLRFDELVLLPVFGDEAALGLDDRIGDLNADEAQLQASRAGPCDEIRGRVLPPTTPLPGRQHLFE